MCRNLPESHYFSFIWCRRFCHTGIQPHVLLVRSEGARTAELASWISQSESQQAFLQCSLQYPTMGIRIPHWPLPAVLNLNHDGRWSTCDVSVLKLSNVSFRGKYARMGNTLKIPLPTKLPRLGHFPPASQAGRLAGPYSMYVKLQRFLNLRCWSMGGDT